MSLLSLSWLGASSFIRVSVSRWMTQFHPCSSFHLWTFGPTSRNVFIFIFTSALPACPNYLRCSFSNNFIVCFTSRFRVIVSLLNALSLFSLLFGCETSFPLAACFVKIFSLENYFLNIVKWVKIVRLVIKLQIANFKMY